MTSDLTGVLAAAKALEETRIEVRAAEQVALDAFKAAIRQAREDGASLAQIGNALGISRQRVDQLSRQ